VLRSSINGSEVFHCSGFAKQAILNSDPHTEYRDAIKARKIRSVNVFDTMFTCNILNELIKFLLNVE
jgi:hypothetical protein